MSMFDDLSKAYILTADELDSLAATARSNIVDQMRNTHTVNTMDVTLCCALETLADIKRGLNERGAPYRKVSTNQGAIIGNLDE